MYKHLLLFLLFLFILASSSLPQFAGEIRWATGQGVRGDPSNHWIGDFNGDGLDDKVQLVGEGDWWVALSNGYGFDGETKWASAQQNGASKYYIGDFDGDGLDDILSYKYFFGIGFWYLASTEQSFSTGEYKFSTPKLIELITISYSTSFVGDFNGDGLDDIIYYVGNGEWRVLINNNSDFDTPYVWATGEGEGITSSFVGDFNGDGYCDKASFISNGQWWVSTGELNPDGKYKSSGEINWANGQGIGTHGHWIGDFNGDGRDDKVNSIGVGQWWVALSEGNGFGRETRWATGQGEGVSATYVGDFDGDELCDKVSYLSGGGEWWVAESNVQREKIVATWFTVWYIDDPNHIRWQERDMYKTPKTGWINLTRVGIYSSQDHDIINMQIDAMRESGIDLILIDLTNGFTDSWKINYNAVAAVDELFEVMANLDESQQLKIAIGLGAEFWGPRWIPAVGYGPWLGWDTQKSRQVEALQKVSDRYLTEEYKDIYFNYLGKPLIPVYLNDGTDYPLYELSEEKEPLWHYNDFTVKPTVGWNATWSGDGILFGDPGRFHNGMDNKRFWGWGTKRDPNRNQSIPHIPESMTIMPGTHNYVNVNAEIIDRENGNYYIKSWLEIIKAAPQMTIITDWNNWNEETAIEGCIGQNGWKDHYGNEQFDWYLQITKAYSSIFKNEIIPANTYVQEENDPDVYLWDGLNLIYQSSFPEFKPVIKLPENWLQEHGYARGGGISKNTGVMDENIPDRFEIEQNYPNPFNPITKIKYALPEDANVQIKVYDVLGRIVTELVNSKQTAGYYETTFDASYLPSGTYFYRINSENYSETKKMLLLK